MSWKRRRRKPAPPSKTEKAESPKAVKSGVKRKTLDWGKIQALHDAGWSHAKIADEMGATTGTISSGLSKLRKEKQDVCFNYYSNV